MQGTAEIEHAGRSLSLQADQQAVCNSRGLSVSRTIDPAAIAEINRYHRGRIVLLERSAGA